MILTPALALTATDRFRRAARAIARALTFLHFSIPLRSPEEFTQERRVFILRPVPCYQPTRVLLTRDAGTGRDEQ